jgi:uncharacterized protein (TIRG00374 family)
LKQYLNWLKYLLLLAAGVLLFWLAYSKQDFSVIFKEIRHIHWFYIALAFIIAFMSHLGRALRWNLLIEPLGYKIRTSTSFYAVMIGYLANLALPRMGEVSRCVVLNRTDKVPVDKLIGTVIVERLVDLISLLVITALAFLLEFERLFAFFHKNVAGFVQKNAMINRLFTLSGALILTSAIIVFIILLIFLYTKLKNHTLVQKLTRFFMGFADGMATISNMKKRWLFLFYSFFIWFMYYLMVYLSFKALNITHDLGFVAALTVLVTGSFGFVMPVQGGLGPYHIAVSYTLLLYGYTLEEGRTFAFVAHTFQMVVVLIFGGLSFLGIALLNRSSKTNEAISSEE